MLLSTQKPTYLASVGGTCINPIVGTTLCVGKWMKIEVANPVSLMGPLLNGDLGDEEAKAVFHCEG